MMNQQKRIRIFTAINIMMVLFTVTILLPAKSSNDKVAKGIDIKEEIMVKQSNPSVSMPINDKVTVMVKGLDTSVECLSGYEDQVAEEMEESVAYAMEDCDSYEGYITRYMDLQNRVDINVDEMNYIIDYWVGLNGNNSLYSGNGQAFIDVSKLCGYDPIFLMSLACNESGWEVSSLHRSKNNPYSINMTDVNPSGGYNLGNSYYDGIVNGGLWIHENYYEKGCKNLHDMIYKGNYASAKDKWINGILNTMNKSYEILMQYKYERKEVK